MKKHCAVPVVLKKAPTLTQLSKNIEQIVRAVWDLATIDPQSIQPHLTVVQEQLQFLSEQYPADKEFYPKKSEAHPNHLRALLNFCLKKLELAQKAFQNSKDGSLSKAFIQFKATASEEDLDPLTPNVEMAGLRFKVNPFITNEKLSYLFSVLLGIDFCPPTILFKHEGQWIQVQESITGAKPFDPKAPGQVTDESLTRTAIMSMLLMQRDGHDENYLVTPQGMLVCVDNKCTCPTGISSFVLRASDSFPDRSSRRRTLSSSSEKTPAGPPRLQRQFSQPEQAKGEDQIFFPYNSCLLDVPGILKTPISSQERKFLQNNIATCKHLLGLLSFSGEEAKKVTTFKTMLGKLELLLRDPQLTIDTIFMALFPATHAAYKALESVPERAKITSFPELNNTLPDFLRRLIELGSTQITEVFTVGEMNQQPNIKQIRVDLITIANLFPRLASEQDKYSALEEVGRKIKREILPFFRSYIYSKALVYIEDPH